ncbi:hypothetical protein PROFUN_03751 [Planoprotostelium fungivorum]|uniref:Uncharacterized protein n=1 Tax=Planoprotostelium fungivorum TaxID=1890364 RepID=A0A2P6NDQ0_9EUKA|nr:hypothetical protein PROFUN_03751 [Planoprotostelium fungivorum]
MQKTKEESKEDEMNYTTDRLKTLHEVLGRHIQRCQSVAPSTIPMSDLLPSSPTETPLVDTIVTHDNFDELPSLPSIKYLTESQIDKHPYPRRCLLV